MAHKSPKRRNALQQAKEYLRANPTASNAQVVESLQVSVGTVSAARSFLVQTGVIPRSYFDRTSTTETDTTTTGSIVTETVAGLAAAEAQEKVESLLHGASDEPLTAEEQRKRISAAARRALVEGNTQLEIAAIQALARLDAQIGARDRLGPGPPLTEEDKITRLAPLLQACGKRIARKAWEKAFDEHVSPQDQPQDRNEPRESDVGAHECTREAPVTPSADAASPPPHSDGEVEEG